MLSKAPNRGDVIKLPQGVTTYISKDVDFNLSFFEEIKKPSVAIFIENFNDNISKLVYQDKIIYVYNEWLYDLGETNVSETNSDSGRSC